LAWPARYRRAAAGQRDAEGAHPQQDAGTGLSLKRERTLNATTARKGPSSFTADSSSPVDLLRRSLEEDRAEAGRCANQPEAEEADRIGRDPAVIHRLAEQVELLRIDHGEEHGFRYRCDQKGRPEHLYPFQHCVTPFA